MKLYFNAGSFKTSVPQAIVKSLGWKDKDELQCKQVGKTLVISLKETK